MESVIVALVSGGLTLIGVLVANSKAQAVTDAKLEELTREVREHNDFARRVPLLEKQMEEVRANIKELQSLHKRQ
jgi:hypothetical protein